MTDDEQMDAMIRVQNMAVALGLHGLMVLSCECDECHTCHQWHVISDVPGGLAGPLLRHFAGVCEAIPDGERIVERILTDHDTKPN